MRKINTALLAFGMSGRVFHAPFITCNEHFNLTGAWERSRKSIQTVYTGVRSYSSLDELLTDDSVELVVVNTPTYTHFDYAKRAIEAGKNVIVEKAFATNTCEAEQLKDLAERMGKKLAVFQNRRWDSDFLTVKDIIESGKLGEVNEVEIHYDRYNLDLSPKPHKEQLNDGSGIVKDLCPHIIDQALVLFGMPRAVFADVRIIRPRSIVDDYAEILLYYPRLRVRLRATLIAKETVPSYIVHGLNGSFLKSRADVQEDALQNGMRPCEAGWGIEPESERGIVDYIDNGVTVHKFVNTKHGDYMRFYDGVYTALASDAPMPVTADDGIRVMKIIDATYKSHAEQCVITL